MAASHSTTGLFTPLFEPLVQRYGLLTAAVYGLVWRYCQMRDGACRASVPTLAARLSISERSFSRQVILLKQDGLIEDRTPNLRNRPHILAVTPKLLSLAAEGEPAGTPPGAHADPAMTSLPTSPPPALPALPVLPGDPALADVHPDPQAPPAMTGSPMSQTLLRDIESKELRDMQLPSNPNPAFSAQRLWDHLSMGLAARLSPALLDTWVRPCRPLSWDGSRLVMGISNAYARDWLTARVQATAQRELRAFVGDGAAALEFVVAEG
jgi:hypothetical protein